MVVCPKCKSKKVASIIYGMPSHDAFLSQEREEIILGGCVICDKHPDYGCFSCDHQWSVDDFEAKDIVKLRVWVRENGPCKFEEMKRKVFDIFRDGKVRRYNYKGPSRKSISKKEYLVSEKEVTYVCRELIKELHSMNPEVILHICDGSSYEIQIKYLDGRKSIVTGDVQKGDPYWDIVSNIVVDD